MWWKKEKPIRLDKKTTKKERICKWFKKHYLPFVVSGVIIALIVFVFLILYFAPGTESGSWYNGLRGVI